jgi:hypothetical protein
MINFGRNPRNGGSPPKDSSDVNIMHFISVVSLFVNIVWLIKDTPDNLLADTTVTTTTPYGNRSLIPVFKKAANYNLSWICWNQDHFIAPHFLKVRFSVTLTSAGPGSSVGIATGYGLDGSRIESRWRRGFPHLSRPALGPTQPPVQWVPGLSRGKERPGRDADPSPPSSAVVMKG